MTIKKIFKIIGLVLLALVLAAVAFYLYLTDFGRKGILSTEPRRPKLEIPVIYNIGWWSDQEALTVDSLAITIVESKLNLFNSKSLIAYKISGHLTYEGHWQPVIKEVHISERVNLDTTVLCDRIIEITPIIKDKSNDDVNGGSDKFEFKNEHTITSSHWGINRIKFICGLKQQTTDLRQSK